MRMVRLYIPLVFLVISAFLINRGIMLMKQIPEIKAKSVCAGIENSMIQQGSSNKKISNKREISAQEMMAVKKIVEGLALRNDLKFSVNINDKDKNEVLINSDGTDRIDVLKKYDKVLEFIFDLTRLPYDFEIIDFCYGYTCNSAFTMQVRFTGG